MHPIQKHIIYQLLTRPEARYRDIKPKDVEGNLFMYHLRALTSEGLVSKTAAGRYQLTAAGLRLADRLSLQNIAPRIQPKIVTLLVVQNASGQYLLYQRRRQPFHNLSGFPYGKIHLGENIADAAARELAEKTGLTAKLTHRGEAYLTVWQNNEIISQMLCHVFAGRNPTGNLTENSSIGRCFWQTIERPIDNQLMPGFAEIFELVKNPGHFFAEIVKR